MLIKLIFLILCMFASRFSCLFEDQTGTYDWRQQYLGKPLYTHIDPIENRIYLATNQNVLAAINRQNGNIIWRKIFENNENGIINYALWSKTDGLLITGNGKYIKAFNYKHGYLKFEYNLFKNNSKHQNFFGFESKIESNAYYFTNGYEVCYLNADDHFCTDLPTDGDYVFDGDMTETDYGVFVIGKNDNNILKIQFNGLLNSVLSKTNVELNWFKKDDACLTSAKQFSCVNGRDGKLYVADIVVSDFDFKEYQLNTKLNTNAALIDHAKDSYLIENVDKTELILVKLNRNTLQVDLRKKIENYLSYKIATKINEKYFVVAKRLGNNLNFHVYSFDNGDERTDFFVGSSLIDNKNIIYMNSVVFDGGKSQNVVNHFCVYEDHALVGYSHTGSKLFVREEALANVLTAEMVDFPLTHLQEEFEEEFGTSEQNIFVLLFKRIKSQFHQAKEVIDGLFKKLIKLNANKKSKDSTSEQIEVLLKRDEFNLNKLIVVVTEVGKVFGIHTANGQIIWNFYMDSAKYKPFGTADKLLYPMYIQRTAAHHPHEAQAVVVAKANEENEKTRLFVFNPLNGRFSNDYSTNDLSFGFNVKNSFIMNNIDSQFVKPIVLFDYENKAHVFPKSSADFITKNQKPHVIYIANATTMTGFLLKSVETPLLQLWNIHFNDEIITKIGAKHAHDRTHSHGKILGDRSVLYKYLNPNLISVATEGLDNQNTPFVNVYLVDTINGNILYSFNHKRCKGPVQIVHSENWFFYSYNNLKYRRYEVSSIELFEGATQFNSTSFSSFDPIRPTIYKKSYIVQKSFDAMQLTITEKGIATKDVIVACPFGTIIEIPWVLIDARRPYEMTELEREENLIPYMPEIPLNYEFSLNYYNYVYNVRGIITSPSGLESTSLVYAYGLDTFFTRVFPSKTFDMLREDFDYFFIITLMVGLLLGTILTKKIAAVSSLKKAWK